MIVEPWAAYHQVCLAPADVWPEYDMDQGTALVQIVGDRRCLILNTGIAMGPVTLDIGLVARPASDTWEEAADGNIDLAEPLYLTAPTIDSGVDDAVITPTSPGTYYFRVCARGRAEHYDHTVESPVEDYRVEFWPA